MLNTLLNTPLNTTQKYIVLLTTLLALGCSHAPKKSDSTAAISGAQVANVIREGRFEVVPLIGNFVAKRAVLNNGLKLIVVRDSSSPTFAYETFMRVGSRNEIMGKTGLAHFFEHLMFKGTTQHKEGEFDHLLESAGVVGENAYTTNDQTVFVQELPKDQLDLIIGLESDRMHNLVVNEDSFKAEREVVLNEQRFRSQNSPEGTLYQALFESAYIDSPYHWPVIGYVQDLNMMTAQDARDFYEHFYSPDRATVVVVGDVDANDVLKKVEKAYGSLAAKNTPDGEIKKDPEQTAQRRKKLSLNIQNEKLILAYKVGPSDAPETPALELLQGVLSEGMNSRLDRALVDTGIASSVSSGSFSLRDPGIYVIMADLQKGKSSLLAEQIILREIERMKTNLVHEDELVRAKNLIRFHFLESMASSGGKARFIGDAETYPGKVENQLKMENDIQSVTAEMVQQVAQKFFVTQSLTVITGVPKGKK